MSASTDFDFIIVGAGSAGCAAAYQLAKAGVGTIAVLEAGLTNKVPQVKIPFGLAWTRGSKRDWKFLSAPQTALKDRQIGMTRGKMIGGSSSINSMVWFPGRRDDYDNWNVEGWRWVDVSDDFETIEEIVEPRQFATPHPLSSDYALLLGDNGNAPPTPERESAGIFKCNLHDGARRSAADAFLKPALQTGLVKVLTKANVDKVETEEGQAKHIVLTDGRRLTARAGILLSGGAIGSPSILLRSGIGPAEDLGELGIEVVVNAQQVGKNLHDHPAVGIHYQGAGSGYGLELAQMPHWALAPFNWLARRKGRWASQIVEAGAFFKAIPDSEDRDDRPDCQSHFIPFMVGYKGSFITWGAGYSADVNVCRPYSRGHLSLTSKDPNFHPLVDPALLADRRDMETLKHGVRRLRKLMDAVSFGERRAKEVYPGADVQGDDELENFIQDRCATAYHPVGTLRIGDGDAPIGPDLKVKGVKGLWVADASIMPAVTTANTNAPSMMIGYRAGRMISEELRKAA